MQQLLTPETFEFFARYLLAGYVVIFVRSAFVVGLRPKPTELLVEAVVLSLIVQLFVLPLEWAHGYLTALPSAEDWWEWFRRPPEGLKFFIRVLLVPVALGTMLGLFLQSNFRNSLLRRFSLPVVHPVRRAHDFAFGVDRSAGFVEVTYEDGTKVAGWFGENSLAATDDRRSDLFLERAYIIKDDGDWVEPSPPKSVLISLSSVRTIEFIPEENDPNGEQDNNAG